MAENNIDTIIFDLGGVLVNHKNPSTVMGAYGLDSGEHYKLLWRKYKTGKCTEDEFWEGMVKGTHQEKNKEKIKCEVRQLFSKPSKEGAYQFVKPLKDLGYNIAILSNHSTEWGRSAVMTLSLDKMCDPVIISAEIGLAKPDPEIYTYALAKVNREGNPGKCIFIDDKEANIIAARDAGMHAIQYISADSLAEQFKEYGVLK